MGKSKISWTNDVWNPIVGCSIVSAGCTNCYAMAQAARMVRLNPETHYRGTTREVHGKGVWNGVLKEAPEHILFQPLAWRKARRIFVNSMSDLFHKAVTNAQLDRIFAIMMLADQHTFQVLTKRSARMLEYMTDPDTLFRIVKAAFAIMEQRGMAEGIPCHRDEHGKMTGPVWPLGNVWLGISAENQRAWDERKSDLYNTPAAVRFVSAEPLIGPIHDIDDFSRVDWVIVGGESGLGSRPFQLMWGVQIIHQCALSDTAVYVKQFGARPMQAGRSYPISDRKGQDMSEWPESLRVRQYPDIAIPVS